MTPPSKLSMQDQRTKAAQHDDHRPPPVCPSSPEGAMPLQSATLPDKKIQFPTSGADAAMQGGIGCGQHANAYEGVASGGSAGCANLSLADIEGNAQRSTCTAPGCGCGAPCEEWRAKNEALRAATLDASKLLPDWKDLDLRPGKVWQMKPEPTLESHEGIPAEVINDAGIYGEDAPHVVLEKLEAQMKGKWVMVRCGEVMHMPPEEMVNVRGEQRPVDEYCVATPVRLDDRSKNAQRRLEVMHRCDKMAQEATGIPIAVPSKEEALAMREMVEKAAVKLRGEFHFDEVVKVVEETYDVSFLNRPRQHDSPLSARVVPTSEAPDPKVGW